MGVGEAYGHYYMSDTDICPACKRLLNPELLQLHLAAFLGFLFPFAGLFKLFLNGTACSAVLKLNLARHAPALSEVVAYVYHGMRNVEASVARIVLILACVRITINVVAVEVARQCHLAISADAQAVSLGVLIHAVGSRMLCLHLCGSEQNGCGTCQKSFSR